MSKPKPISIKDGFSKLKYLGNRTPESTEEEGTDWFAMLENYRDGSIFIAYYAGNSEWERHSNGDEIVFVLEGETSLFLLSNGNQVPNLLRKNEFLIVPQNVWHRFETPKAVKVLSITPQPTDHCIEKPEND